MSTRVPLAFLDRPLDAGSWRVPAEPRYGADLEIRLTPAPVTLGQRLIGAVVLLPGVFFGWLAFHLSGFAALLVICLCVVVLGSSFLLLVGPTGRAGTLALGRRKLAVSRGRTRRSVSLVDLRSVRVRELGRERGSVPVLEIVVVEDQIEKTFTFIEFPPEFPLSAFALRLWLRWHLQSEPAALERARLAQAEERCERALVERTHQITYVELRDGAHVVLFVDRAGEVEAPWASPETRSKLQEEVGTRVHPA